jgi:hypothetical protein
MHPLVHTHEYTNNQTNVKGVTPTGRKAITRKRVWTSINRSSLYVTVEFCVRQNPSDIAPGTPMASCRSSNTDNGWGEVESRIQIGRTPVSKRFRFLFYLEGVCLTEILLLHPCAKVKKKLSQTLARSCGGLITEWKTCSLVRWAHLTFVLALAGSWCHPVGILFAEPSNNNAHECNARRPGRSADHSSIPIRNVRVLISIWYRSRWAGCWYW